MQRDGGPGGAGGAGNPVGGSFTGAAQALEIIGDHCYAYSGEVSVTDSDTTFFEYTSGSYYALLNVQIINFSNSSNDTQYKVNLNDNLVGSWVAPYRSDVHIEEPPNPFTFIVPPYTKVKVTGVDVQGAGGLAHTASITGRIYRG